MIYFLFTLGWSLTSYGQGGATVIAPNVVEALKIAAGTDDGWMLLDPAVNLFNVQRTFAATCDHNSGSQWREGIVECHDCRETWPVGTDEYPEPCATRFGFEVYCENLRNARQYPYNPVIDGV